MIDGPPPLILPPPAIVVPAPASLIRSKELTLAGLPGMMPVFATARGPMTLNYVGAGHLTTNVTSYDFGNFTAVNGLLIVAVRAVFTDSSNLTGVTIGGVAATIHQNTGTSSARSAVIASRVVAAGAQNITATFSAAAISCSVFVWTLRNYLSATPVGGGNDRSTGSGPMSMTFDIPANGIAVYVYGNTSEGVNIVWSSATERYDADIEGTHRTSAADITTVTALPGHVETVTTSSTERVMAGASWG